MKRALALGCVALLTACSSGSEPPPEESSSAVVIDGVESIGTQTPTPTASVTTTPTPTPSAPSDTGVGAGAGDGGGAGGDGSGDHGIFNYGDIPEGLTEGQWESEKDQALWVAGEYYKARFSRTGYTSPNWVETASKWATDKQHAADAAYVEGWEWNRTKKQIEEADLECKGNIWINQGWTVGFEPTAVDRMTLAIPTRDECMWGTGDTEAARQHKLQYDGSQGLGGYQVRITSFRMLKTSRGWKVDEYNPIYVTDVIPD